MIRLISKGVSLDFKRWGLAIQAQYVRGMVMLDIAIGPVNAHLDIALGSAE